jgi:tRNA 2-thiouridine synthesizing protein B
LRLHTVNQSPGTGTALASCLRVIGCDDCLLLIEDGVYAGCDHTVEIILESGCKLFALAPDADARGLLDRLDPAVELVDYAGFVSLVERCDAVTSWY